MPDSEARWFKIISFVVTGIIAGLLLADIIYFNELRKGATLSNGEVTSMLIISGIIFAITIMLFIWSLVRLFIHKDVRDSMTQTTKDKAKSFATSTGGGINQQQIDKASTKAKTYYSGFSSASNEAPVTKSQELAASD